MIILKEKVAGYNNILTLATKDMKFRVNENINYVEPVKTTTVASKGSKTLPLQPTQDVSKSLTPKASTTTVFPKTNNETAYLLGSVVTLGFLVARYVI